MDAKINKMIQNLSATLWNNFLFININLKIIYFIKKIVKIVEGTKCDASYNWYFEKNL